MANRSTSSTDAPGNESTTSPRQGSKTGRREHGFPFRWVIRACVDLWSASSVRLLKTLQSRGVRSVRRTRPSAQQTAADRLVTVEYDPQRASEREPEAVDEPLVFQLDSLALHEAYQSVCSDPDVESLVYLTGPEAGNRRVVARLIEVEAKWQSATGIRADPDRQYQVLQKLADHGHNLLAYCHNHPGEGRRSIRPSSDDWETQHRLEALGFDAIGLIMTRDGYVNVFSEDVRFKLEVYGDNVQRVDQTTFQLEV